MYEGFLSFMSVLRMLTMARLYKCKSTTLLHFRFISNQICVLKIPNCNFLFSQLQIAVILLFPLNTENPSLCWCLFYAVKICQILVKAYFVANLTRCFVSVKRPIRYFSKFRSQIQNVTNLALSMALKDSQPHVHKIQFMQ